MNILIENYFSKLDEVKTICNITTTTKTTLETKINELSNIETNLTNLFSVELLAPTEFNLFFKIIMYEIEKNDKKLLQSSLLNLIKIKKSNIVECEKIYTFTEMIQYLDDNKILFDYINNIINSCDCMESLRSIIQLS